MLDIVSLYMLTGMLGDAALQVLAPRLGGPTGWGLNAYFKQHGRAEALCIAGGMLVFFIIVYLYVFKLPLNPVYLALYGVALDLLFRRTRLFPSLDGYYAHLNYFWSAVWGTIPMLIPYYIFVF